MYKAGLTDTSCSKAVFTFILHDINFFVTLFFSAVHICILKPLKEFNEF